jgi:hypothetical protein
MKNVSLLTLAAVLAGTAFAQWEPDVRMTNDPANSFLCGQQCFVAIGDTLHAVFVDDRSGSFNVYHTRSLDAGVTWDSVFRVSPGDSNRIFGATIAASGPQVHVVWEGRNYGTLRYRRSDDGGATWQPEVVLVESPRGCGSPVLSTDGDRVGLVWGDGRDGNYNGELYYKQSLDAGANWTPDTRLTVDQDSVLDKEALLSVSGGYRYLTWTRYHWRTGHTQVWFARSVDDGSTWEPRVRITDDTTRQDQPMVAAVGSAVHLCWQDGRPGGYGVYYRGSTDNGGSWGAERWLTDSTYGSDYPAIAAAGGNVHVAFRANHSGQLVIDYRGSTDNGQTWSPDTTLSSVAGMGTANLAATGSRAHILLYDDREGNFELYHKRNLTAGAVEERHTYNASRNTANATVVRGVLHQPRGAGTLGHDPNCPGAIGSCPAVLLDACGRRVMMLRYGANDVSRLAPGVYFVMPEWDRDRGTGTGGQKVVVAR